ncbi:MAG: hypothetical protein L3J29_10495 [Cyclobacteriaceae bacterium]|nr:hypothetical protein [Cyclobacteriaceae bacterium]
MKLLTLFILILCSTLSVKAQKIKYKDLYVLLRAKNYKDGAGFLAKFLSANPEHPNANYQMGLMLEFKLKSLDLLKESEAIIKRADSAIFYFDKAYSFINAKDVKKHDDDYYELFKRRNLRTGKFEVILSDVQLDIENRKNILNTNKEDIKVIKMAFNGSVSLYDSVSTSFQILKTTYKDILTLSLGATDVEVHQIEQIIVNYDSSLIKFKQYKKLKKQFSASSDETIINIKPLAGFEESGLEKPDFYSRKVSFSDFSTWGKNLLEQINVHHLLLVNLVLFDESLEALNRQIFKDSVDLSSNAFKKITDPALKNFREVDSESVLYQLLNYKIGQLNLNSTLMTWYKSYADTLDIGLQLNFTSNLKNELESIKKLHSFLGSTTDEQFMLRYRFFVESRYNSLEEFNSFLEAQPDRIRSQEEIITQLAKLVSERDKWTYTDVDSIPLSITADSLIRFNTFYIDSLENRELNIVGLSTLDSRSHLYFAKVPSSRQLDSLYKVETSLTVQNLVEKSFIVEVTPTQIRSSVFLIGDSADKKYMLIHYLETGGVLWSSTIDLENLLSPELSYSDMQILISQGDIVLKFKVEDGTAIE